MTKKEEYEQKIEEWKKLRAEHAAPGRTYEIGEEIKTTKSGSNPEKFKKLSKDLLENYEEFLSPVEKHEIREAIN